jgi:hypothetical protein
VRYATIAKEIKRDCYDAYGYPLPDDDAGRECAALILLYSRFGWKHCPTQLDHWCPWMPDGERERMLADVDKASRPRHTPDQLARMLGTTYARRQQCGHTMIGAIDVPKAERDRLAKENKRPKDRERSRRKGQERRKRARAEYLAQAQAKRDEIKASGRSRRTWYRRRRNGTSYVESRLKREGDPTCANRARGERKDGRPKGSLMLLHRVNGKTEDTEGRNSTQKVRPCG